MCALKKLMNSRGRSTSLSTPTTRRRYVRRADRSNTDGLSSGQRNIVEMMNAQMNGGKEKTVSQSEKTLNNSQGSSAE